jgi:Site-specific recombinase XerD
MTSLSKTDTGTWYIQYRIPGLPNPQKEFFGKDAVAKQKAEERIEELKTGYLYTPKNLSSRRAVYLDELGQCYIDVMKARDKTTGWINVLKYLLNDHYLPCLCYVPVDQLTFQDVVKVADRFNEKSVATRNRYMDSLQAIFRFGISHELTTNNPMKHWKKVKEKPREVSLTVEDLTKIYAVAPPHLQWIVEVEWELGTRPGKSELFSLKWSDIDFDNDILRVRGTKTLTSNRLIPLTPQFKIRLLEMKEKSITNYVIEYRGKPLSSCRTAFRLACEKAGISYSIRLYDIRHLFASTILANGGDLKAVSKLLGHSNTKMTADVYYHELKGEKALALTRKPVLAI